MKTTLCTFLFFLLSISLRADEGENYFKQGSDMMESKEYKLAIVAFTNAINYGYKNYTVYYNRGFCKGTLEDFYGAIEDYSTALTYSPNSYNAIANRGFCYGSLKKYKLAYNDFSAAIKINPNDGFAYYYRACVNLEDGSPIKNTTEGCKDLSKAGEYGYDVYGLIKNYCK